MEKIFVENISDLAEAQRASFYYFLDKGIGIELKQLENPIKGRYFSRPTRKKSLKRRELHDLYFIPDNIKIRGPFESLQSCQTQNISYSLQIYVSAYYHYKFDPELDESNFLPALVEHPKLGAINVINKKNIKNVIIEQDYLLVEIPLITDEGNFLITGCERIVINQIIRSPGVYFRKEYGTRERIIYTATIISDKGLWTKIIMTESCNYYETGNNNIALKCQDYICINLNDLTGKTIFSLLGKSHFNGLTGTNKEILIKPEEIERRDLLSIFTFFRFFKISFPEILDNIENSKFLKENEVLISDDDDQMLSDEDLNELLRKIFYNGKTGCFSLGQIGRYKVNKRLGLNLPPDITYLTGQDLLIIVDKLLELKYSNVFDDDIDHIKNKQIRSVGDFLQNQLRIGLYRSYRPNLENTQPFDIVDEESPKKKKSFKNKNSFKYPVESLNIKKKKVLRWLFDPYPISSAIKEFFKGSQLSQFMDQINVLAEITQKRRVSVFGPNGLKRDHISTVIRDIHPSQYGRLCPVETPEGQNAGLITSLAIFSRISSLGWLETPYFLLQKGKLIRNKKLLYINPENESKNKIAFCDVAINKEGYLNKEYLSIKEDVSFSLQKAKEVDFLSLSPIQLLSLATTLIPFVEHNDANRALMGSNMQRQAVPLIYPQKAIIGTGFESVAIFDSDMTLKSYSEGNVSQASASFIDILDNKKQKIRYYLQKYLRSNQETCINQRSLVWQGEKIFSGQVIADGASSLDGELALGRNLTIAYMPWDGYNYEDAIVLSERLVLEDCLTSIHIEEYETTRSGLIEEYKIMKQNLEALPFTARKHLDENGIVKVGTYVQGNSILAGKVIFSPEEITPAKRLQMAIRNQTKLFKDVSFKMPFGCEGRVIAIRCFSSTLESEFSSALESDDKEEKDEFFFSEYNVKIKFFIAQTRKIQIGDKLAGRHGNKGIISKILPRQDMPYLPDGRPIDIIFNPLGVPSRMNVGQVFECLLGLAGENLGRRFKVKAFDEIYGEESSRILINQKLKEASFKTNIPWLFSQSSPGKILLRDGRTGEFFDNPITVGKSYILKLIHLVEDKIHARPTGPYALITEQPLAGKSQNGGQRLGEMEVWALEAYGCSHTLHELLTIKSDDIDGRLDMYQSILRREFFEKPQPGLPESFLLLIRELNALGLDFEIRKVETKTIHIQTTLCDIFQNVEDRLKLRALYKKATDQEFIFKRNHYLDTLPNDEREEDKRNIFKQIQKENPFYTYAPKERLINKKYQKLLEDLKIKNFDDSENSQEEQNYENAKIHREEQNGEDENAEKENQNGKNQNRQKNSGSGITIKNKRNKRK